MTISKVGFGVGGGGSTHDRPPQKSQSWAPKKGTNTEPHDHGETSQIEHSGVAAVDARSSKVITGDSIAAVQATSGAVDAINETTANPTVRQARLGSPTSSDLYGSTPTSSDPAIGAHPKSSLGPDRSLPSPNKQVEHESKSSMMSKSSRLLSSPDSGVSLLPGFAIPISWVSDRSFHSVTTPTPSTGSKLLSTESDSSYPDPCEGSHGRVSVSVIEKTPIWTSGKFMVFRTDLLVGSIQLGVEGSELNSGAIGASLKTRAAGGHERRHCLQKEAGVRIESGPKAGFSRMPKLGAELHGPDPVEDTGKGVNGVRLFGSHKRDKTPAPEKSRLIGVAADCQRQMLGISLWVLGFDMLGSLLISKPVVVQSCSVVSLRRAESGVL